MVYNNIEKYYIPFVPKAKVNYFYLFHLYSVAEYNKESKLYDTIRYKRQQDLAELLDISLSQVKRILDNDEYKPFIEVDKTTKSIRIKNNFRSSGGESLPFVCLTQKEVQALYDIYDNLLCKYLIYIKYWCGYTKKNETDFTAKQFLEAVGLSTRSNYPSLLSEYNGLLVDKKIITIKKYHDEKGFPRNIYKMYY